jgi:hypothetical protein
MQWRGVLMLLLFEKMSKLSVTCKTSSGQLSNLFSTDTYKISNYVWTMNQIWGKPLVIIILLSLIYRLTGALPTLIAIAYLALLMLVVRKFGLMLAKRQNMLLERTDLRVDAVTEV